MVIVLLIFVMWHDSMCAVVRQALAEIMSGEMVLRSRSSFTQSRPVSVLDKLHVALLTPEWAIRSPTSLHKLAKKLDKLETC